VTGYAPYPLDADLPGLVATVVTGELGTTVARHHAERHGTRATVFLHGAAGSWTTWTPLLRASRDAGIDIAEPVLFDLPGWGDGVLVERDDTRTIDTVCELVRDALVELGYSEWDLVGHSMGGFIAMHMAAIWPGSVSSVATVSCTSWSVIASVGHPVRDFGVLPGFTTLWQVMRGLSGLGRLGRSLVRGMGRAHLLRPAVAPLFRHPSKVDHTVIDSLSREVRPHSFAAAAEIARGYDADGMWSTIRCPVRAVKGDRDVFVRDDDLARLRAILPDAATAVIADCGHFGNVERPAEALAALELGSRR
jgi:pimeloyl-ACP methyl ester carboxylesterase